MTRAQCSNDISCLVHSRSVAHRKTCPMRQANLDALHDAMQAGNAFLVPGPTATSVQAVKEPVYNISRDLQAAAKDPLYTINYPEPSTRPWWKFWGRRG